MALMEDRNGMDFCNTSHKQPTHSRGMLARKRFWLSFLIFLSAWAYCVCPGPMQTCKTVKAMALIPPASLVFLQEACTKAIIMCHWHCYSELYRNGSTLKQFYIFPPHTSFRAKNVSCFSSQDFIFNPAPLYYRRAIKALTTRVISLETCTVMFLIYF